MSLRAKVITGLYWTAGARLLTQVVTWASTVVVIRILTPADYGLLAMATLFVSFLVLIAETGLAAAIVQAPELDAGTLKRVYGAVILTNTALFAAQWAAAPLIAAFFGEERVTAIIRVLALQYIPITFAAIPRALLARSLAFKGQSVAGLGAAICGSLTSLALAFAGYGIWALVVSSVLVASWNAIAINFLSPFRERPDFSLRGIGNLIVSGSQFTMSSILWFIYSQADTFIAGKVLGKELLGFYAVSMHLASLPVQRLSGVLNQVAYPAFAALQHEPQAVRAYVLKAIRILSFTAFPVLWGMSSVAPEGLSVLLGAKWAAAVLPLQILCLVMPLTMLNAFLNTAYQGIGKGAIALRNTITAVCIMPAAFWIGTYWGLLGLSLSWLIGFTFVFAMNLPRMLRSSDFSVKDLLQCVSRPVGASGAMYACVALARVTMDGRFSDIMTFVVLVLTGVATYVLLSLLLNRSGVSEIVDLFLSRTSESMGDGSRDRA